MEDHKNGGGKKPVSVQRVEYFCVTVDDKRGEGYKFLEFLNVHYVNLRAFSASPAGNGGAQIDFFLNSLSNSKKLRQKQGLISWVRKKLSHFKVGIRLVP